MIKGMTACIALALGIGIYFYLLDDEPSVKMAESMVEDTIDYISKAGPEQAIKEINAGKSDRWHRGDIYVFVYQVEPRGYMVAHAINQGLVNKNLYDLTDPDGKFFVKEYLDTAIETGRSKIPFKWPHPVTNKIENKTGVCRLTNDKKYVVCSGAYKK
ncbi:MAG: cache domain-containing protein [Holosporales bacterium]|jgi:signal transduction histidine kinase|nr:cache domain-containing protein [Holosporales bacterium]